MTDCDQIDAIVLSHRPAWLEELSRLGEPDAVAICVATGLVQTAGNEDWSRWEAYVVAASRFPNASMTGVLCDVLLRRIDEMNIENIVDVLGMIGDPRAVPALAVAVNWDIEWDEFHGFAKKCVMSLSEIGDPAAIEVLRLATSDRRSEVRELAQEALTWSPRVRKDRPGSARDPV